MQKQINISVKVPPALDQAVKQAAQKHNMNRSDWVRTVLSAATQARIVVVANEMPFTNEQPERAPAG